MQSNNKFEVDYVLLHRFSLQVYLLIVLDVIYCLNLQLCKVKVQGLVYVFPKEKVIV